MKVLAAVVVAPHLDNSGAVNAALSLSRALAAHVDIDVALMSSVSSESTLGDARLLKRRATNPLGFTKGFAPDRVRTLFYRSDIPALVRRGGYDLVHLHNPIPTLEMRRIARAAAASGIPYVVSTHGFVEVLDLARSYRLAAYERLAGRMLVSRPLREVIAGAAAILALTPSDASLVVAAGVPENRISIVPNGLTAENFASPPESEVRELRQRFDLMNCDGPLCFFLANHTRNKGLDVLLDAFSRTDAPYVLAIGGKKRQYAYDDYAARCRSNQRMIFTDTLTDKEVHAFHHIADLFVFPSLADTSPLVVLEAMAAGTPVLSTTVGGIPHQVPPGHGVLVEPGSAIAFQKAFERLAENRPQLATMGDRARAHMLANFSWTRSAALAAEQYHAVLAALVTGSPSARRK